MHAVHGVIGTARTARTAHTVRIARTAPTAQNPTMHLKLFLHWPLGPMLSGLLLNLEWRVLSCNGYLQCSVKSTVLA
jgi:uncharacterized protein YhjY with autotransporter beta-barrel domain